MILAPQKINQAPHKALLKVSEAWDINLKGKKKINRM